MSSGGNEVVSKVHLVFYPNLTRALLVACLFLLPTITLAQGVNEQLTSEQKTSFEQLKSNSENLNIVFDDDYKFPKLILAKKLKIGNISRSKFEEVSYNFFEQYSKLYSLENPREELQLTQQKEDGLGINHLRFRQYYESIPVFGYGYIVHIYPENDFFAVNGKLLPDINIDTHPAVTAEQSINTVYSDLLKNGNAQNTDNGSENAIVIQRYPQLYIYFDTTTNINYLSYRLVINNFVYLVDAHDGSIIRSYSNIQTANLETYTANNSEIVPGTLWIEEDLDTGNYVENISADDEARNAHDFAKNT